MYYIKHRESPLAKLLHSAKNFLVNAGGCVEGCAGRACMYALAVGVWKDDPAYLYPLEGIYPVLACMLYYCALRLHCS